MNTDHNQSVITRIPPSPTGHLHFGTARTALFNYLFAKQQGGSMLFRSEDTDRARSQSVYEEEIIDGLHWLGIDWDNDQIIRQSERAAIYRKKLEHLLELDKAYESIEPSKQDPSRSVTVVRLRNPGTIITFKDLIRGEIRFDTTELGDFVIARAIDDALYHLTVVVDDAEMGVTHILRGEDHISNTPRQILLQEALGYTRPVYAHLPLILAPDRSKMSKRHGPVSIAEYREQGYLPETLVNYLALLGWNPGTDQEIFTLPELVEQFTITQIQKSGAIFDITKLKWLNKQHLAHRTQTEQVEYIVTGFTSAAPDIDQEKLEQIRRLAPTVLERAHTTSEIVEACRAGEYDFILNPKPLIANTLAWKNDPIPDAAKPRLAQLLSLLTDADFSSPDTIKAAIWPYVEATGKGEVLWPMRMALTGQERSPDPFTVAYALGQPITLERLQVAYDTLGG